MSANVHINRVSIEATIVCECGHIEPRCFFEFTLGSQKWVCPKCKERSLVFLNVDTTSPDDHYGRYLEREIERAKRGEGDGMVIGEDEWRCKSNAG